MITRLDELKSKETLTDKEMNELVALSPKGTFKSMPNILDAGVVDLKQFIENYREGAKRSRLAFENGCFIEVISLRLQHSELWLRTYYISKNKSGKIFEDNDKRTFGMIINDCSQLGFDPNLILRLKEFNKYRVDAIHKFLLGVTNYDALRFVCEQTKGLDFEVSKYVCEQVGIPM